MKMRLTKVSVKSVSVARTAAPSARIPTTVATSDAAVISLRLRTLSVVNIPATVMAPATKSKRQLYWYCAETKAVMSTPKKEAR